VGFEFSGPFAYTNSSEGNEVTLSLALRAEDRTILDRAEKTVPADFSGGWIFFDALFEMEGGRKYYFTCHLKDGEITGYQTGVTGWPCPDWPPSSFCPDDSYGFEVEAYGQDMENLDNWKKVWAVFNLHVSGIFTGKCYADSDLDQDVDGADLAVFSGDFAASLEAADLNGDNHIDAQDVAVFAAELGRTDCPACMPQ
jgi:hypothetical protein